MEYLEKFKALSKRTKLTVIIDVILGIAIVIFGILYLAHKISNIYLAVFALPCMIAMNIANGVIGYKQDPHKSKLDFIFAAIISVFFVIYLGNII